jgi:hypothetical protein
MKMKWNMKAVMMVLAAVALSGVIALAETKYSTSTNADDPTLRFGPQAGRQTVKSLITSCDTALGTVKFYARTGNKYHPSIAPGATPTNIYVTTGGVITNGDQIAYVYSTGEVDIRTCTGGTGTNIYTTAALSGTGTTADWIYEISQQGEVVVADNTAGVGTNKLAELSGDVFETPGDSPLYMVLSSSSNTSFQATVK